MNTSKASNYGKLIAFFLIAAILLCTFGLAAEGWQPITDEPDSGKIDDTNDEADENKDGNNEPDEENKEPEIYIPEFTNSLTGLETTGEIARLRPLAFVMNSTSPMYGISSADILVELPIEDGTTRLVALTSVAKDLGKIGSIAPTRGYISNIAKYFGAIAVCNGNDGKIDYESCDMKNSIFDLSLYSGYHYTEYTHFNYTNGALIYAGISNANIGTAVNTRQPLPYSFNEFGNADISGTDPAKNISIQFSSSSASELYYSDTDQKYVLSKGGVSKNDMLNDSPATFDNVFILLANTVTYESAEASEMVMDTLNSGTGYYMTRGSMVKIRWEAGADGILSFFSESGERLTVNRGTSYIGFVKSSMEKTIKFN